MKVGEIVLQYAIVGLAKRLRLLPAVLLVILGALPLQAQKTDVIVLRNGDRITGEIKEMEKGRLRYSTDDMGTISVEWDEVARIWSNDFFEIELTSGDKHFGMIQEPSEDRQLMVALTEVHTLDMGTVVSIIHIEASIWTRMSGFIDIGFSFFRADWEVELDARGELEYRGTKHAFVIDGASYLTTQESTERTRRNNLALQVEKFLAKRMIALAKVEVQQNDELGLDLRSTYGIGAQAVLARSNKSTLEMSTGILLNRERFIGADSTISGLEAAFAADFETYRYDTPELSLNSSAAVFPSLGDWGRVRVELDVLIRYEVFGDFFVGLNFYERYDSRPPATGDVTQHDFGITTSVGYSF